MKISIFLALLVISNVTFASSNGDMLGFVKALKQYKCTVAGNGVLGAPQFVSEIKYFSAKSMEDATLMTVQNLGIRNLNDGTTIYELLDKPGIVEVTEFKCELN